MRPEIEKVLIRVNGREMIALCRKSAGELKLTRRVKAGGWIETLICQNVPKVFFGHGGLVGGEISEATARRQVKVFGVELMVRFEERNRIVGLVIAEGDLGAD